MVQQALIHLMQSEAPLKSTPEVYTFNENLLKLGSPPLASIYVE